MGIAEILYSVIMLCLVLALLADRARVAKQNREFQRDALKMLSSLVAARMRKGDFKCYCGGTLQMGQCEHEIAVGQTVLECERCEALIILPMEGART